MQGVSEFKYLRTVLCKHEAMKGDMREKAMKDRQMIGTLNRIMKGRNVSMGMKKGIRNSIVLSTLS